MAGVNCPPSQWSDWITPEPVHSQQHLISNKVWPINDDENYLNNEPTKSWVSFSVILPWLFMGVLTGCLILTVLVPLWLTSSANKATTATGIASFTTSVVLNTTSVTTTTSSTVATSTTSTTTSTTTAGANITVTYNQSATVNVTCTNPMRITIVSAFYGVPACANCSCGYCLCANMTVTSTVITICTNHMSCSFSASDIVLGDPCFSYSKTFIITYSCS